MPNGGNGPCVLQNKVIDRCHYVGSGAKFDPTRLSERSSDTVVQQYPLHNQVVSFNGGLELSIRTLESCRRIVT